ncbi:MAG TPA: hypothetical protein PLI95_23255, partial [Polyangiaceae bacterium]|nr:hypothetical protein [Polyangiaceae bacterium]
RLAAHASDDLENTPSTIWDCPPQTDPETAPVLSRIVLLGPDAGAISPAEIGIGVLLGNLRIGDALPRSLVMQRLLHGIRRSKMVRAPNRPPMAATLAPQLAFVQPLLQGLQDHRDGL